MDKVYIDAVNEHVQVCRSDLDDAARRMAAGGYGRRDRLIVERVMQVLIESCIGVAKHWNRDINSAGIPSDAYSSFTELRDRDIINDQELQI